MKKYQRHELSNSIPFRTRFNRDSYMLFKEHFPNKFSDNVNGLMRIWKDKKGGEPSLFNKLGTNYTAYTELINLTLEKLNDDTINPTSIGGYNTIIDYLKSDKKFFESILPQLGKTISSTTKVGDKAEVKAEEAIKDFFPGCKIEDTSGLGKFSDMMLGMDRKVICDGNEYNIQIKVIKNISKRDDKIIVDYLASKSYKSTDFFIFNLRNNFYLFKNDVEIGHNEYIFPKSAYLKKYEIK